MLAYPIYNSQLFQMMENSCPSIRLRILSDFFEKKGDEFGTELLSRVFRDPRVERVVAAQNGKGWFFNRFHGTDSTESAMRFLLEMGIPKEHKIIQQSSQALIKASKEELLTGIGNPGWKLEKLGLSGSQTIRAWLLALAGKEEHSTVHQAVEHSIQRMAFAAGVDSFAAITQQKGKFLYLAKDCPWPDLYTFRLLAATQGWRTVDNLSIVESAIKAWIRLEPLPAFCGMHQGKLIAPAIFGMQQIILPFDVISDAQWMVWFHRMELLARLGMLKRVSTLTTYIHDFFAWLQPWQGWFGKSIQHTHFSRWGAYTGLMLEKDWRNPQRRQFDLTFRCLLIWQFLEEKNSILEPDLNL